MAWLSHLLLDSFYNHGRGVLIFWPLSRARLNLAIPWFATLQRPLSQFRAHTARVLLIEVMVYGAVFGAALTGRFLYLKDRKCVVTTEATGDETGVEQKKRDS